MATIANPIEQVFQGKSFEDFAKRWASDPFSADKEIHDLIVAQIGSSPQPDPSVYKTCGTAIWRPQTCGHRDRMEADFYQYLTTYSEKYYSLRRVIVAQIKTTLQALPGEVLMPLFTRGETSLLARINSINGELQKSGITETVVVSGLSSLPVLGQVLQVFSLFRKDLFVDHALCKRLYPPPFFIIRDTEKFNAGMTKYTIFRTTSILDEIKGEFSTILEELFPQKKLSNPESLKQLVNFNPLTALGIAFIIVLLALAYKRLN